MNTLEKFADWLSAIAMWGAMFVGFLMMLHVAVDIVALGIFHVSLFGTIEIVSAYYMVALTYLPLAWIVKNEGHIFVELFTKGLSARALLRLDTFVMVLTLIYVLIVSWKTLESAIEQTHIREKAESALGFISVWPSRWFVVIGFSIFALQVFAQLLLAFARIGKAGGRRDP